MAGTVAHYVVRSLIRRQCVLLLLVLSYTAGVIGSGRNDGANGLLPVLTGQELDWLQVLHSSYYSAYMLTQLNIQVHAVLCSVT
jgi:hypothetical protein